MELRYIGEYEKVSIVKGWNVYGEVENGEVIDIENEEVANELLNTNKFEEVI